MSKPERDTRRVGRGRPARLSQEQVIEAAMSLFEDDGPGAFSMANVAKRLGASTMSLYTYFPSRDALLDAVADRVFQLFTPPLPSECWRAQVQAWLRALREHFQRHPIAMEILDWQGHVPPAWLRIWAPILHSLEGEGLRDEGLSITFGWFMTAAVGVIVAQLHAAAAQVASDEGGGAGSSPADTAALDVWRGVAKLSPDERSEFAFDRLLDGLETCINLYAPSPDAGALAPRPAKTATPNDRAGRRKK